jgi:predicted NUDIX family NTP pyrophosphohydrolase
MGKARISAGLLLYRLRAGRLEVFLAHPGGPLFQRKDDGYWSIPKGEVEAGEDRLAAAKREFAEEVGLEPHGEYLELGVIRQKGGKRVHAWAFAGDWEESRLLESNRFEMEWPPKSGQRCAFPEIDRVGFFGLEEARRKLKESQHPLLDRLKALLQPSE